MRKLGDVEWIEASKIGGDQYSGISIGIRHIGPGQLSKWMMMRKRWEVEEVRRRRKDPDGILQDLDIHIDSIEPLNEVAAAIARDCVTGLRGVGMEHNSNIDELIHEIDRLGLLQKLSPHCMAMQSLKPEHPLTSDPGHSDSARSPESVPGSPNVGSDVEPREPDSQLQVGS